MNVGVRTLAFHRPITMNSHKSQRSSQNVTFPNIVHFQSKKNIVLNEIMQDHIINHINNTHI